LLEVDFIASLPNEGINLFSYWLPLLFGILKQNISSIYPASRKIQLTTDRMY